MRVFDAGWHAAEAANRRSERNQQRFLHLEQAVTIFYMVSFLNLLFSLMNF